MNVRAGHCLMQASVTLMLVEEMDEDDIDFDGPLGGKMIDKVRGHP